MENKNDNSTLEPETVKQTSQPLQGHALQSSPSGFPTPAHPLPKFLTRKILILVLIIWILIMGIVFGVKYYTDKQAASIVDFETCAAAGFPVQESYPATCRTNDGRSFTQVLSEEEQKNQVPPTDITADWQSYEGDGFSFKYPDNLSPNNCPEGFENTICSKNISDPNYYPEAYFYYAYVTQEQPKESLAGIGKINYETEKINDIEAIRTFDLPSRAGAESVFFKKDDGSYIQFGFTPYDNNNPFPDQDLYYAIFQQILSTFQFTDSDLTTWKDYKNTNQKYEVKYPGNFSVKVLDFGEAADVSITPINATGYEPSRLGLRTKLHETDKERFINEKKIFEMKDIKDGLIDIIYKENNRTIYATCVLYNEKNRAEIFDACNKIMSTFKFTK